MKTHFREVHPELAVAIHPTITSALQSAHAGDVITIHEGIYRESLLFPRDGTCPKSPILIRAGEGETVTIKGSDVVTEWVRHRDAIWKKKYWRVNSQQVFSDDKPLRQIAGDSPFHKLKTPSGVFLPSTGSGLNNLQENSFWYDSEGQTLYIWLPGGSSPEDHRIEVSTRPFLIKPVPRRYISVERLNFRHSNTSAFGILGGMVNVWGQNWVVVSCTFNHADFAGISIQGEGHRITKCQFNDNGNTGVQINGSDDAHAWQAYRNRKAQHILLEDNESSHNNTRGFDSSFQGGGVKLTNGCNTILITEHRADDNIGPGIWVDLFCADICINRCRVSRNTLGIGYEISDRGVMSNNLILRNKHGIIVAASNQVSILNNTLHQNDAGIIIHGMPRAEHPTLNDNLIYNNILSESSSVDLVVYSNSQNAVGNRSDFNLFTRQDQTVSISWTVNASHSINYRQLGLYQDGTGQDRNSLVVASLWTEAAPDVFLLPEKSPAIDAGTCNDLKIGFLDFAGNPRVINGLSVDAESRVDMGAFEFRPRVK